MDKINRIQKPGIAEGNPRRFGLHKGAVLQHPGLERAFKGLGVAKRYCRRNVNGDRVSRQRTLDSYIYLFNLLDIQRNTGRRSRGPHLNQGG